MSRRFFFTDENTVWLILFIISCLDDLSCSKFPCNCFIERKPMGAFGGISSVTRNVLAALVVSLVGSGGSNAKPWAFSAPCCTGSGGSPSWLSEVSSPDETFKCGIFSCRRCLAFFSVSLEVFSSNLSSLFLRFLSTGLLFVLLAGFIDNRLICFSTSGVTDPRLSESKR